MGGGPFETMTSLREQLQADAANLIIPTDDSVNPHVETIVYTAMSGTPSNKSIQAIVDLAFDVDAGAFIETEMSLLILSDADQGIENPVPGDTLVVRNRKARVVQATADPDGYHDLGVKVGGAI